MITFVQDRAQMSRLRLFSAKVPMEGSGNFATWLALFKRVAEQGYDAALVAQDIWVPMLIGQRRMVERLALRYATVAEGAGGPLTEGLATYSPRPARAAADSRRVGLGRLNAPVVLVGDAPQPGAPRWAAQLGWPFISGLGTGCSSWLAEQLEEEDVPEYDLFWLNARLQDGTPDQRARETLAWHYLFPVRSTKVIALGRNAAETLEGWGMPPDEEVHHPQHWKRFKSRHEYLLPRLINKMRKRHARDHQPN